jgi:site-specific recombinase XerD
MAIRVLTYEEVKKLLIEPQTDTLVGLRNRAILETLYGTGIQVRELLALEMRDIDFRGEVVHVRKKGRDRIVSISASALLTIQTYRDNVELKNSATLFLTETGERITGRIVTKIMKQYSESAGFEPPVTAKDLRFTFGVHMLRNGASADSVRELLGISTMGRIQRYCDAV